MDGLPLLVDMLSGRWGERAEMQQSQMRRAAGQQQIRTWLESGLTHDDIATRYAQGDPEVVKYSNMALNGDPEKPVPMRSVPGKTFEVPVSGSSPHVQIPDISFGPGGQMTMSQSPVVTMPTESFTTPDQQIPVVWQDPQQQFAEALKGAKSLQELYSLGVKYNQFRDAHGVAQPNAILGTGDTLNFQHQAAALNSMANAGLHQARTQRVPGQMALDQARTGLAGAQAQRAMMPSVHLGTMGQDGQLPVVAVTPGQGGPALQVFNTGVKPRAQPMENYINSNTGEIAGFRRGEIVPEGYRLATPVDIDNAKLNNPQRLLEKAQIQYRNWSAALANPGGEMMNILMGEMAKTNPAMAAAMSNPEERKNIARQEMGRLESEMTTYRQRIKAPRGVVPAQASQAAQGGQPQGAQPPPANSGVRVGAVVSIKGKQMRVTKVNPDGTFEAEPVQ